MRVLITSIPGHGHICPLIPLAKAIQSAGHCVAFATSSRMAPTLEKGGLTVLPSGPEWLESSFTGEVSLAGRSALFEYLEADVHPRMLSDLQTHISDWSPDVLLSNEYEVVGRCVAEASNIPFVLASSGPRFPRSLRYRLHGALGKQTRMLLGLATDSDFEYALRFLRLCFSPAHYVYTGGFETGYVEDPNEFGVRPEIDDEFFPDLLTPTRPKADKPIVLCTFGTVFNKSRALLKAIIAALSEQAGQLIILLGPGVDTTSIANLPSNVEVRTSARLSALLSDVDFCVTHGGTSTLATALLGGKPSLLLPQGADQLFNAIACRDAGLAVILPRSPLHSLDEAPSPSAIAAAFAELKANAAYSNNAAKFQGALHALPGNDFAVKLIERLVQTRAPVLRDALES